MKSYVLTVLSLFGFINVSLAAGFDCEKANTKVEKMICDNKQLSQLDDELNLQYQQAKKEPNQSLLQLKNTQKNWLTFQRNTCPNMSCLLREYKQKLNKKVHFLSDADADLRRLPPTAAYGDFTQSIDIMVYDSGETVKQQTTQGLTIHPIPTKPTMAILDLTFIFNNYHTCELSDQLVFWVENHWQLTKTYEGYGKSCQLSIYPSNNKVITRANESCRQYCGARGYLDKIVLDKTGPARQLVN